MGVLDFPENSGTVSLFSSMSASDIARTSKLFTMRCSLTDAFFVTNTFLYIYMSNFHYDLLFLTFIVCLIKLFVSLFVRLVVAWLREVIA